MNYSRITVFGGSGFLGRQIVWRLAEDGALVHAAVRHPERAPFLTKERKMGQITPVYADVWDEGTVAQALEGADAVINTVGHYVERGKSTFEAIHGKGAMHVAKASRAAGVPNSCTFRVSVPIHRPKSPYVRARGIGERLVKEAFPGATILRPSVIFGPEDAFFNRLASLARGMPVLPLFGRGKVNLQPVYVGDVAEAVSKSLAMPATEGKIYELGGPEIYSYKALFQLVLTRTQRRRVLMPVPFFAWEILAAVMAMLPNPPLSRDQVKLMKKDNVVSADALTMIDLGIEPTPVATILPMYLGEQAD